MSMFSAIDTGRTGVGFSRYWLDTIAHNMANLNTVRRGDEEPFRSRMIHGQQMESTPGQPGRGVGVRSVLDNPDGAIRVLDPDHPLADDEGYVTMPVVDPTTEMTNLIIASRSYQLNMRVISSAREAYESALRIGRG